MGTVSYDRATGRRERQVHPLPDPPGPQVHRWWQPARCAAAPTDAATTGRYTEATGDVGDDCGVGIKLSHLGDLPVEVGPLLGGTDSAATDQLWFVELSQVSVNVVEPLASGVATVRVLYRLRHSGRPIVSGSAWCGQVRFTAAQPR